MAEIIKLKVPDKEGLPESVNQGNHYAELTPGGEVEAASWAFADWLMREFGLEELPTEPGVLIGDLGKLKVAELIEKATGLQIENAGSLKKNELIEAIVTASQIETGENKLNDGGNE